MGLIVGRVGGLTIANILTLLRLAQSTICLFVLSGRDRPSVDRLDICLDRHHRCPGWTAGPIRNEVTRFGTLVDPLADKLMVLPAVFFSGG